MIVNQTNPELLKVLRSTYPLVGGTIAGIGPGGWDRAALARAQERRAYARPRRRRVIIEGEFVVTERIAA